MDIDIKEILILLSKKKDIVINLNKDNSDLLEANKGIVQEIKNDFIKQKKIEKINKAYRKLQKLCDTKSQEAKNYIAGKKVTYEQLARYEEKFQIATEYKANGNYADILKLEADLQGVSVDNLANLIIVKGKAYKQALINFNAMIEAFRVKVSYLIETGQIDKAMQIIEQAKSFGADTTPEDIKALFNS